MTIKLHGSGKGQLQAVACCCSGEPTCFHEQPVYLLRIALPRFIQGHDPGGVAVQLLP